MTLDGVYRLLEQQGLQVVELHNQEAVCLSVAGYIGIDTNKISTAAQEKTCLMHEGGHCASGSFYGIYSPLAMRGKCELAADRWAVKKLVPKNELIHVIKKGYTESWQLAEFFDVTEAFIQRAIYIYFELEQCNRDENGLLCNTF